MPSPFPVDITWRRRDSPRITRQASRGKSCVLEQSGHPCLGCMIVSEMFNRNRAEFLSSYKCLEESIPAVDYIMVYTLSLLCVRSSDTIMTLQSNKKLTLLLGLERISPFPSEKWWLVDDSIWRSAQGYRAESRGMAAGKHSKSSCCRRDGSSFASSKSAVQVKHYNNPLTPRLAHQDYQHRSAKTLVISYILQQKSLISDTLCTQLRSLC